MRRSFINLKAVMIITTVFLLLIASFRIVESSTIEVPNDDDGTPRENNGTETERSVEEKLKELRIEMVKFQILSKLNLKEPPHTTATPSESSREAIRLLLQETDEVHQPQNHPFDSEERLIIHAKGSEMECLQANESYCKMFRFELSAALNMSTMDLWLYKLTEFPRWLSVSLSLSGSNDERYYDRFYYEVNRIGWNKLQLPRIFLPSSFNDSVIYSVEIIGQNVEHRGDHRPFLMVSKSFLLASRQRRDINCDTNENCCLKPLRVSVAEIGFNWVLYPEELEANMCTGKCRMDHSSLRTHYERAMTKVLENDSTLQETLGECWTLCCKPKQLEAVRVIYNDTDGIIHDQYIPELSVKSCSCS